MSNKTIHPNGVDALTGKYLLPPLSPAEVVALARSVTPSPWTAKWLTILRKVLKRPFLGLPYNVNPKKVPEAGWAIVFHAKAPQALRHALEPLIAHRRKTVPPDRLKILEYRPGESLKNWLKRHRVAEGNVLPQRIPYYVLLVGEPTDIPFDFQCLLSVEYAVGRLAFEHLDQYRQYVDSVVAYEEAKTVPNCREMVFWGTRHPDDGFTQLSSQYLITRLCDGESDEPTIAAEHSFNSRCFNGGDATKDRLLEVFQRRGDTRAPAILLTASHGMGLPKGHAQQHTKQGALLCQDWTGQGSVKADHYMTAAEITDDAHVHGIVAFVVACYGAGVPEFDSFLKDRKHAPVPIADRPFVSALPQRLLSHPQGGALAVIGHIERLWSYSFVPPGLSAQLIPFRNFLGRVVSEEPIGHAMRDFRERYTVLAAELLKDLDATQPGPKPSEEELAWKWVECVDAQNYVVLGDPAVRLRVHALA